MTRTRTCLTSGQASKHRKHKNKKINIGKEKTEERREWNRKGKASVH
jgi:hypothetical protein